MVGGSYVYKEPVRVACMSEVPQIRSAAEWQANRMRGKGGFVKSTHVISAVGW